MILHVPNNLYKFTLLSNYLSFNYVGILEIQLKPIKMIILHFKLN